MPILKFIFKENKVILDGLNIENITRDNRTKFIDTEKFINKQYQVENNVYIVVFDIMFKLAKIIDKNSKINAMLLNKNDNHIIFVPSGSYVFWQGKSIEPNEYKFTENILDVMKLITVK
jgi:hypothetical protein